LNPVLVIAVLCAVGIAVYAGAVTSTYALADDYHNVVYLSTPGNTFLGTTFGAGRAVSGTIQYVVLGQIDSVEALGLIRLIGVVGVLTAGAACYYVLTRLGMSSMVALGCGATVVAMPSSIVVGVWATMFPASFACAAALVAAAIAVRPQSSSWPRTCGRALVAGLLVLLALQTYQPAATAYWAVVAAAVLLDRSPWRSWIRAVFWSLGIFAAALATYAVSVRISLAMGAVEPLDDRRLIIDPIDKLWWFVTDVLPLSLNPFSLSSRPPVAGLLAVVVLIGIYLRTHGSTRGRVSRCAIAILCVPGSYLSNLVVIENWPAARTRLALDITVVVLAGVALEGWAKFISDLAVRRRVLLAVVGAAIVLMTVLGAVRANRYFALPLHAEQLEGEDTIERTDIDSRAPLYIIYSSPASTTAPGIVFDEFGYPTLSIPWSVIPFVQMALEDQGRPEPSSYVLIPPGERDAIPAGAQVLDLS
jgi:hypothetical protein